MKSSVKSIDALSQRQLHPRRVISDWTKPENGPPEQSSAVQTEDTFETDQKVD